MTMTEPVITTPGRVGRFRIERALTDAELQALAELREHIQRLPPGDQRFAASLLVHADARRRLTRRQLPWVGILADRAIEAARAHAEAEALRVASGGVVVPLRVAPRRPNGPPRTADLPTDGLGAVLPFTARPRPRPALPGTAEGGPLTA
jgi:hypothetical protein